ncbi:DUF1622 domain-containing protein [Synechococcus elongatus]|uniref:Sll0939 protein n=2 Tax=Synechococcus elongatus TaxID=32046 RepID=Q31NL1_SYNE7|nr:DUF1622 domain-containing protein [Synechococcus elongatus]ABB57358.1 conserved hypothetical protein [Synechococcus elongatus PCC 7942 = FACHB-805]AJD58133.1 hypothetical protein M744_09980 [Synechococcus elongatus UTEX 2973]MBD2587765.1 DUF1622 domain-containing protein [Synechococcus elongatus FACHB-242]MBD2688456.1 DUF1622 domain-containing protein [Synechococcus elongatus FACHB-1061]MBD2707527.1 DUF1622 domain-containing protein [Synechococcus elongatus PCC 7942 = FACHB-805]
MPELAPFEYGLAVLAMGIRLCLESLSVLCVVAGLLSTLRLSGLLRRQFWRNEPPFTRIRLTFGGWLSLALEFQLGADIVATTTSPSTRSLLQLGAVALIRTFLNFFLAREMEMEQRLEQQTQGAQAESTH